MTARRHVLVVADDLTGANATAARFARASLRSATVNYTSIHEVVRQFDAIIVSTESRHAEPEHAADRVRHVIAQFPDATLAAEPITTYDATHKGAGAYRQLARELIARGGAA